MLKPSYLLFTFILFYVSSYSQKLDWPLQVKFQVAAILVQGDTANFFGDVKIDSIKTEVFNFIKKDFTQKTADSQMVVTLNIIKFFNALFYPTNKEYPINQYGISLDSLRKKSYKNTEYFVANRKTVDSTLTPDQKLKLVLNVLAYPAWGACFATDSVVVGLTLGQLRTKSLNHTFLNSTLYTVYKFVCNENVKTIIFYLNSNEDNERFVFNINSKFRDTYETYIRNWTTNILYNSKIY